jgi:hypothetical protein
VSWDYLPHVRWAGERTPMRFCKGLGNTARAPRILNLRKRGFQPLTGLNDVVEKKRERYGKMKKFFGLMAVLSVLSLGCEPTTDTTTTTPDTTPPAVTEPADDTVGDLDTTTDTETDTDPIE